MVKLFKIFTNFIKKKTYINSYKDIVNIQIKRRRLFFLLYDNITYKHDKKNTLKVIILIGLNVTPCRYNNK